MSDTQSLTDKGLNDSPHQNRVAPAETARAVTSLGKQSLVLVGLMGAGKTTIGRRLASRLDIPFIDVDQEIEKAAGCTIADIFKKFGEEHFRDGERRVIARLLNDGPQVLATGGGAFMNDQTRTAVREKGLSIWLKVDIEVLMKRVARRSHRPLLQTDDPRAVMQRLMDERYPVYAQAALTIDSKDAPHDTVVDEIIRALDAHADNPSQKTQD